MIHHWYKSLLPLVLAVVLIPLAARADDFPSPEEINSFARSAFEIEQLRRNTLSTIREQLGQSAVPSLRCHQRELWQQYEPSVRRAFDQFCRQSAQILDRNGLSPSRFIEIRKLQNSNPTLKERVQTQLMQMMR
ncbi:DUF4168 domain-containing protein [Synechococcus elongatus IITB7]|uniref:DUF4168 domain-containing protein n=1 Tax=Synechococcus elongatus TaxID=32046 RepID=UPI0030D0436D